MKKTAALLLAGIFTAALLAGCGTKGESKNENSSQTDNSDDTKVQITVKEYGTIEVALDEEAAPLTVENFLKLTEEGFYDGLTFHRIIDGFMIQGGDPKGNGTGGSDETIKGEFSENGVENPLSHTRGAISMARSQDYDSASSQFFIVQEDSTYLDGQYAAFGYVTEGMDVVDKICEDVSVEDQNGTVLPRKSARNRKYQGSKIEISELTSLCPDGIMPPR